MNRRGCALPAALLVLFAGCSPVAAGDREGGPRARTTRLEAPAHPPVAASSPSPQAPAGEADPVARALMAARILTLTPASSAAGHVGTFEATLEGAAAGAPSATTGRAATLTLALNAAPIAHRRPLAFSRLATALRFHVVPTTVARSVSLGELGALLRDQPAALEFVRAESRVQNDGTVDALLAAPPPETLGSPSVRPRFQEIDPRGSYEVRSWERQAASPTPVAGESSALVRDFVEMLVLDYLSAFAVRRAVFLLPDPGALLLEDNREAFPLHADPASLEQLLRRLRAVARFPRGLRDALVRFDRAHATAVLAPAGFETWLLSPRSLLELDERRAGLLSLVEAQIVERGEAAVLSL